MEAFNGFIDLFSPLTFGEKLHDKFKFPQFNKSLYTHLRSSRQFQPHTHTKTRIHFLIHTHCSWPQTLSYLNLSILYESSEVAQSLFTTTKLRDRSRTSVFSQNSLVKVVSITVTFSFLIVDRFHTTQRERGRGGGQWELEHHSKAINITSYRKCPPSLPLPLPTGLIIKDETRFLLEVCGSGHVQLGSQGGRSNSNSRFTFFEKQIILKLWDLDDLGWKKRRHKPFPLDGKLTVLLLAAAATQRPYFEEEMRTGNHRTRPKLHMSVYSMLNETVTHIPLYQGLAFC